MSAIELNKRQIFTACQYALIDDGVVKYPLFAGRTIFFQGRLLTKQRLRNLVNDTMIIKQLLGEDA